MSVSNQRSSYKRPLEYSELFRAAVFLGSPSRIVEFGVLDGYSLQHLAACAPATARIEAFDIFEDFVGNHAHQQQVEELFKDDSRVSIRHGDLFNAHELLKDGLPIDILHVDIANDGEVIRYVLDSLMPMMAPTGVIILEGGSQERDNVEWMLKYAKLPMRPLLNEVKDRKSARVCTLGTFPSLTLIRAP